jgi:hypothetical protein
MRYFGGKSKISKDISNYINNIINKGEFKCNISEVSQRLQKMSQSILTLHTHTHTLCRTFLWKL